VRKRRGMQQVIVREQDGEGIRNSPGKVASARAAGASGGWRGEAGKYWLLKSTWHRVVLDASSTRACRRRRGKLGKLVATPAARSLLLLFLKFIWSTSPHAAPFFSCFLRKYLLFDGLTHFRPALVQFSALLRKFYRFRAGNTLFTVKTKHLF